MSNCRQKLCFWHEFISKCKKIVIIDESVTPTKVFLKQMKSNKGCHEPKRF